MGKRVREGQTKNKEINEARKREAAVRAAVRKRWGLLASRPSSENSFNEQQGG